MNIESLLNNYIDWLKDNISFEKYGQYYEITAPFLDASNDYLQLYVKMDGNDIYFTDDGATISGLELNGMSMTPKRKKQLKLIASQFGVNIQNNELVMKCSPLKFPERKHMFVQAMLRIGDMYLTSQSKTASFFLDDVINFFNEKEIYCTENVSFSGKTGYNHVYDFLFQRSKAKSERLCNAISNPSKTNVNNSLFSWLDTKETRPKGSKFILLLNDENKIGSDIISSAENYEVSVVKWSERNTKDSLELFAS